MPNPDDVETVGLVVPEVLVYRLPPRQGTKSYRAASWGLDKPMWTGRLKITSIGSTLNITLQDGTSGELFARCPVKSREELPKCVEPVSDSSRYFVLRVVNDAGKHAFLGMGFAERGNAFDFNVTVQDHFKREEVDEKSDEPYVSKYNLELKEGQTFKLNIKTKKKDGDDDDDDKPKKSSNVSISLNPAGAGGPWAGSSGGAAADGANPFASIGGANPFGAPVAAATQAVNATNPFAAPDVQPAAPADDPWGNFASAPASTTTNTKDENWVQF